MTGEVGFDVDRLTTFAGSVGAASPGLGTLETEIATLRGDARPLLGGQGMPSDHAPCSTSLKDTATDLLDTKTEILRRVGVLQLQQTLEQWGVGGNQALAFVPTLADPAKVDEGTAAVRDLLGKDAGMNGNRDDIEAVQATLAGLNGSELDGVVENLSAEELAALSQMLTSTDDSGWTPFDHNGLERWQRMDFYTMLLTQVSPSNVDKLTTAFGEVDPSFESTDSYLGGANPQTGENATGMHYGVPDGEVFPRDAEGRPVVDGTQGAQGTYGDCWFVASTLANQAADPDFATDNVRPNPNGTVSVRMFDDDGNPHWVTTTADLPLNANGDPIGAHSEDGSTWMAYYEKAFAMVYQDDDGGADDEHEGNDDYDRREEGTYGALEWDFPKNAAPYITGNGADDMGHDFDGARDAFDGGRPTLISTPAEDQTGDPPSDWDGYVNRHVYYVVGATEDTITVANPWGPGEGQITMDRDQFDHYFDAATSMDQGR